MVQHSYKTKKRSSIWNKNSFIQEKKKQIIQAFKKKSDILKKQISVPLVIPQNYKNFVDRLKDAPERSLLKSLPFILLSITYLLMNNRKIIFPLIQAIEHVNKNQISANTTLIDKIYAVILSYIQILKQNDVMESLEISFVTISLILHDIPEIFRRVEAFSDTNISISIMSNLVKSVNELKKELIARPKERIEENKKKIQKEKEQREMHEEIKEFNRLRKQDPSSNSKGKR